MGLKFDYGPLFDRLWASYPLHVGKMAAYKAFGKLNLTSDDVEELVRHIERRKKDDVKWLGEKGVRYIPHLATFLNQHRWEDEYAKTRAIGMSLPGILVSTDDDNRRAWARDQQKRGYAVPANYQHYLTDH